LQLARTAEKEVGGTDGANGGIQRERIVAKKGEKRGA